MLLAVVGQALLSFLFAVGLGGSLGEQLGKKLGKNPRVFAGVGAGVGLLALVAVGIYRSQQEPEPPTPWVRPGVTASAGDVAADADGGDLAEDAPDVVDLVAVAADPDVVADADGGAAWLDASEEVAGDDAGGDSGEAAAADAGDASRVDAAEYGTPSTPPAPRRGGLAWALAQQ